MRILLIPMVFLWLFASVVASDVSAQRAVTPSPDVMESLEEATESAQATVSAEEKQKLEKIKSGDITKPEEEEGKQEVLRLFEKRPADTLTFTNFAAYFIQYAVKAGVPSNTVILILLLPLLASIVAFFRHVVGLPSIGMLVPVALSITLVATGITAGLILTFAIVLASFASRMLLKRIRIMQLPKSALSIFVLSIFIMITLTISASMGILTVRTLSIFPVLLLILLSEQIVTLQLERSISETFNLTMVTIFIGLLGFVLLSSTMLQDMVLLYPETVLLLIPLNIAIGRYFGLRVTEYFRFAPIERHGS